ncbi:nifU-like protein 4, mitochondrial [Cocos nucifera]|uniref:NifU-like protein 4, mitochondrial n=1 Tax=Cocos nucifera TaxID=13894 RepID=A0A8K0IX12_COCNU|nr:nifU-like protein 4, mitochondrial [Cocos nucifera]
MLLLRRTRHGTCPPRRVITLQPEGIWQILGREYSEARNREAGRSKKMMRVSGRLLARRFLSGTIPKTSPTSLLCSARDFSSSSAHLLPHRPSSFAPLSPWRPPNSTPWFKLGGQKRSMFIQTQSTPNPMSLMFYPGKPVMEVGSADFPNARAAMNSPLAKSLFGIDGITRVFFGSEFITVTKSEEVSWDFLKPEIFAAIMDFYSSGKPLFLDSNVAASMDTAIHEDDSEIVAMIKELLETRIRPAVQDDGGDIEFRGFDPDTGIVKLKMQGACSGCPSSSVTLKSGIENMLMHYVPEVRGVEQELDNGDEETLLNSQMD